MRINTNTFIHLARNSLQSVIYK